MKRLLALLLFSTVALAQSVVSGGTVAGNLLPDATGRLLGNSGQRWDAYVQALDVSSGITGVGAFSVSNAGVFTNGAMHEYTQSLLNSCSPTTEFEAVQSVGRDATEALTGCVTTPVGAGVVNGTGIAGYARTLTDNTGRAANDRTHAVGGYLQARCSTNGGACTGANTVSIDDSGLTTGIFMTGIEVDTQPQNASTAYVSGNLSGIQNNLYAAIAGDYGYAMSINKGQVGNWGAGILFNTSAIGANTALQIQPQGNATALANYASPPVFRAIESYWNGAAAATQEWQLNTTIGTGANPTFDNLVLEHSGGPGGASHSFQIANGVLLGLGHADGTETTFVAVDDTVNRAIQVPNADGYVPVLPSSAKTETGTGAIVRAGSPTLTGTVTLPAVLATSVASNTYGTGTNCSSSAAPAVCGSAASGSVVVAAAGTTVTVNTTAVTANSQILLTRDNSLGTKLSVTCNTQSSLVLGTPYVSARTAATSFTITIDVGPTTDPMCISYTIVN